MLHWDDVLTAKADIVTQETGDELVVVLPDRAKFVVLNATGARVLALSDGTRSLREVALSVAEAFDADVARVEADVLRFAATLVERGVLSAIGHECE